MASGSSSTDDTAGDRTSEWFVPAFGPSRFRSFLGLLFLPYTAMVLSFVVIGSVLASPVHWDRLAALLVIYFLALGIGAHALDAVGSKGLKPWGTVFTPLQLRALAVVSLVSAYAVAIYYMVLYAPLLWPIAITEGFFVLAYNLEWFHGRYHSDGWFAFSWGFMPVLAGYVMQANRVSVEAVVVGASMGFFSVVEIKASRPYKLLRRRFASLTEEERALAQCYETILRSISRGVIILGGGLLLWRVATHLGD